MAIVRHLAELHGGVEAFSQGKGKGATFTIKLPLSVIQTLPSEIVQNEETGLESQAKAAINLETIRVLIVDDDTDTCEMLNFALHQRGALTQTSNSVEEALTALTHWQPDIFLTDINMPGEDGYNLIGKVRSLSQDSTANIPVIALTAMARLEDSEKAIMSGFQLHLAKPVDIQELTKAILYLTKKAPQPIFENFSIPNSGSLL